MPGVYLGFTLSLMGGSLTKPSCSPFCLQMVSIECSVLSQERWGGTLGSSMSEFIAYTAP